MREERSVCRYCSAGCGTILTIDDEGYLTKVGGDRSHALSKGYLCIKGLQAVEAAYGDARLRHAKKRTADGGYADIPIEIALNEIADRLKEIIEQCGPGAIAGYRGVMTAFNNTADQMLADWLTAIGSPSYFTNFTIDQSAKGVTAGRLGSWHAGHYAMDESDVMMLVGSNPVLALGTSGFVNFNATKQMKASKARGMKLIVVDPRLTETAKYADVHIRPHPGEDTAVIAGILHIILNEAWHDAEFCEQYVEDLIALHEAVRPFTPEYVAARSSVDLETLRAAAALFGRDSRMGFATTSTGVTMAPRSNLIDHLVQCLNVVCGRYRREGDRIMNPGVLNPRRLLRAQVIGPYRSWIVGHQGRTGFGTLGRSAGAGGTRLPEMMSTTIADEILLPGPGRIRCLIVQGGNPISSLPNPKKTLDAFRSLDLLVSIDPYMSSTGQLAHYVLPTKVHYERADFLLGPAYEFLCPTPFGQYLPAVASPPKGADVVDDWYIYWALAKRLAVKIVFKGVELSGEVPPTTDDLLEIMTRGSQIPISEIKKHPGGRIFDVAEQFVGPAEPGNRERFEVAPIDVLAELADALASPAGRDERYSHLLITRRMREVYNSFGQQFSGIKRRHAFNPAWIHPADLADLSLTNGDRIELVSANGRIPAIVEADDTMLPGTISMSHSWGGLPNDGRDYEEKGSCTNDLISVDRHREDINAMAWMSSLPVNIVKQPRPIRPNRLQPNDRFGVSRNGQIEAPPNAARRQ